VTLSDNLPNSIEAASSGATLTNNGKTISGAGSIGQANGHLLTLSNAGTINATGVNSLRIDTGNSVGNTGIMEATGTGGLVLTDTVNNAHGTIKAMGTGAHVDFNSGGVAGGTLASSAGGVINVNNTVEFDGASAGPLAISGSVQVAGGARLVLAGAISNTGTIGLNSTGSQPLAIHGSVTLQGGGHVTLSDNSNNSIVADVGGSTLTNVNNIISGAGTIGGNGDQKLTLSSSGTIDATGANHALVFATGNIVTNTGTLEATGTGGLATLDSIHNSGGTIEAVGAGAHVDLVSGSSVVGGTLATSAGGVINVINPTVMFDGASAGAIVTSANLQVADGAKLQLTGKIGNSGTINLNSAGNLTSLAMTGSVTLQGGGAVTLSDKVQNLILADVGASTLTNVGEQHLADNRRSGHAARRRPCDPLR
jgi:hypothetical protein